MKLLKFYGIFMSLLFLQTVIQAQDVARVYKTNEYMSRSSISNLIQEDLNSTTTHEKVPSVIDQPIGIVFNVIYSDVKISEEDLKNQVEALNRDFGHNAQTYDHEAMQQEKFETLQATMNLNFCLPSKIDNEAIESIIYRKSTKIEWPINNDIKSRSKGGIEVRKSKSTINIWVAELENNAAGFAQMPGGNSDYDGIVIDPDYLIKSDVSNYPFHQGKTLTHLLGNYLGLYPLWGNAPCQDDLVADTPIHNSPSFGCPEYRVISPCNKDVSASMHMNFMDGSNDECTTMFTAGQKERVYQQLIRTGSRHSLIQAQIGCSRPKSLKSLVTIEKQLNITPNPASEVIEISHTGFEDLNCKLIVHNINGSIVHTSNTVNTSIKINLKDWPSGMYQAVMQSEGEIILSKKFIVVD